MTFTETPRDAGRGKVWEAAAAPRRPSFLPSFLPSPCNASTRIKGHQMVPRLRVALRRLMCYINSSVGIKLKGFVMLETKFRRRR